MFMDGAWTISMAVSLPLARPAQKLARTRPTASILGPHTMSPRRWLTISVTHSEHPIGATTSSFCIRQPSFSYSFISRWCQEVCLARVA